MKKEVKYGIQVIHHKPVVFEWNLQPQVDLDAPDTQEVLQALRARRGMSNETGQ